MPYDSRQDTLPHIAHVQELMMFCDWKAASEKHRSGSLARSIQINRERFQLSEQLLRVFENTRRELGW